MSILSKYFSKSELKTFHIWCAILALLFLGVRGWLTALDYAKLNELSKYELKTVLSTMYNYKIINKEHVIEIWKDNIKEQEYNKLQEFTLEFRGK